MPMICCWKVSSQPAAMVFLKVLVCVYVQCVSTCVHKLIVDVLVKSLGAVQEKNIVAIGPRRPMDLPLGFQWVSLDLFN